MLPQGKQDTFHLLISSVLGNFTLLRSIALFTCLPILVLPSCESSFLLLYYVGHFHPDYLQVSSCRFLFPYAFVLYWGHFHLVYLILDAFILNFVSPPLQAQEIPILIPHNCLYFRQEDFKTKWEIILSLFSRDFLMGGYLKVTMEV